MQSVVGVGIAAHPIVDFAGRQQGDGDEQRGHHRQQEPDVLGDPPDGHRPTCIAKMMQNGQEQGAQAQAEEKHERQEIRVGELLGEGEGPQQPTGPAGGHQNQGQLLPDRRDDQFGGLLWRRGNGGRTHKVIGWESPRQAEPWSDSLAPAPGHLRSSPDGCVGARGRRPRWPTGPQSSRWRRNPASRSCHS